MNTKSRFAKSIANLLAAMLVITLFPAPALAEMTEQAPVQGAAETNNDANGAKYDAADLEASEEVLSVEERPAFSRVQIIGNERVYVYAPEGVFPRDAKLSVKELTEEERAEDRAEANAAIEKVRDNEVEPVSSRIFEIKVLDVDGVTELQPEANEEVFVFFALAELRDKELESNVYRVYPDKQTGELSAKKQDILEEESAQKVAGDATVAYYPETTIAVKAEGLSCFGVEFMQKPKKDEAEDEQAREAADEQAIEAAGEQAEEAAEAENGESVDAQEGESDADAEASTMPAFNPDPVEINGVTVSVSAPEGVFPEGAMLSVEALPAREQQRADDAIDELRDADRNVAVSYTFDIKVLAADGLTEIEPADDAKVKVSFKLSEAADANLETDIYHVRQAEGSDALTAEKLDVVVEETADGEGQAGSDATATVETDSFSYYTVEFTYGKLQYVLKGDSSVPLHEILSAVGLTGEVTSAEVSDDSLFTASNETGEWVVTALQPFLTEEWMKVTIGGVVYEIMVKDDPGDVMVNVAYLDGTEENGVVRWEVRTHSAKQVPSNGAMTSGWYYLDSNVTVDGRVSINGDTYLILGTGNKLDVKGFYVPKGSTLTIYSQSAGNGRLYSHPSGGAAIGAYAGHKGGNIVIYGGDIEAYGADHCAGIGSNDDDRKDVGSITIYGGNITAKGGNSGAGLGGGRASEGGNITIYGGTINATGGHYGAGIGGGNGQETDPLLGAHGGTITIYGGNITAKGGDDGAGIGGGEGGNAGTITINGGTVNATGGNNSAGIGTGEGESTGVGGTVTINGGDVTAWGGGDAAGIGGGEDAHCDTITINGGTVKATGGSNGAGIGAGRNADGGLIIITGGHVTAEGKDSSAGIGGADPSGSFADQSSIEISGGTVIATGNNKGAGIGGGEYGHAAIRITGGDITAKGGSEGGAGIGNGKDGSGSAIILDYTDETAETISITINRGSYKGTVTLLKPFKNSASEPEKFRETGSVSDLGKLSADPPLVAWTDAEPIATEVTASSWEELQAAIDDELTNEKKITLTADIFAESTDTRIEIPNGKNITIDLAGFTMDRMLSDAQAQEDGSVIHVERNATLTILDNSAEKTGVIAGGNSFMGGGILNEGTLTIKGGTITGNKASVSGGANGTGGGIYNAGTLTVSGGSISGNTAGTWGGGIYLADGTGSVLNLSGGSITGNSCGDNGGGVHVSESAFMNVSGAPVVENNTKGNDANNVNLADGTFIHVTGALKEEARIGMHMSFPTTGNITSGLKGRGTAENFTSDDAAYEVRIDGTGEAYLYKEAAATVDSWDALQNAVNAAQDGDIIRLNGPNGEVKRTGSRTRIQVDGNKRITIDLAGNKLNRDLDNDHDDGQVIEVFDGSTLTIRDSVGGGLITGGYAKRGGGICIDEGATCIITGGTITGNRATDDGGGIYVWGTLKMTGGAITHNSAEDNGGGLFVAESGRIDLTGADISYNTAEDDGGGFKTYSEGDSRITDCTITHNKTNDKYGAGFLMDSSGTTMTITDTRIAYNSSDDDGGGIYLRAGKIVMNGGSVSENWSRRDSGGVRVEAKTTFTANGVTIHKNTADTEEGGGVKSYGTTTLTNCVISGNKSKKQGGGLYNDDADGGAGVLNLYGCTVFGNSSQDNGGGIYADYKLTVIGGSVTGNISNKRGGGIFIGDDSKDTYIGGNLVVKDNGAMDEGKEIFLRTKRLVVQEKLLDGAMIGITKESDGGVGEFTSGYPAKNGTDDPSLYFFSPEGFAVGRATGTNEAELVSGWKQLQAEIDNSIVGKDQAPNTITLTHDYAAASDDRYLVIPHDKAIIIDLAGHTLNRNLNEYGTSGSVFCVEMRAKLTLIDSTAPEGGPGTGTVIGGYNMVGGGIYIDEDASLTAEGIVISDNIADADGGGVWVDKGATLTMTNCAVTGNYAYDNGGGIFSEEGSGTITLNNVSVLGNICRNDGAGMKLWLGADASITNCEISGNSANDHGGGMYIEAKDSKLTITGTVIDNNSANDDGAGILLQTGRIDMTGGSVSGNTTKNDGGGVKVTNKTEFHAENVVISNNTAETEQGGGVKNCGVTTLKGCTISGNYAGDCGGGIFNDKEGGGSKGQITVESCRIYGNSTAGTGGGIWNNYELTLKGNNLIGAAPAEGEEGLPGNIAEGSGGGGIYFRGDDGFIKLEGSLVATGNAAAIGEDIYLKRDKKLVLTGSITGTNVGKLDMSSTGEFTTNYSQYHPDTEPRTFFGTSPEAIPAEWNDDHTEAMLKSDWPVLQDLIDAAAAGQSMEAYGHPETADGLVVLDKIYTAGTNNTSLKIKSGYNVTVDLNGYILDRNLNSKKDNGQIFEIYDGGTLTIKDSSAAENGSGTGLITGGYSGDGGGIYINSGGTLNMESGMIAGNNVKYCGAGIYNCGTLNMTGGVISGNGASVHGGGIFSGEGSSLSLENVLINGNGAGERGGGLYLEKLSKDKTATIENCAITENQSREFGAGMYMNSPSAVLALKDTSIDRNVATDDGAGVYLNAGRLEMTGGSLSSNTAHYDSGGIKATNNTTFIAYGTEIKDNRAIKEEGGGVKNYGTTTLENCTISGNKSEKQGGGVFNSKDDGSEGTLTLKNCTVENNAANHDGGGVYSNHKLSIDGGTFAGNTATEKGGGVFIGGDSANTGIAGAPVIRGNTAQAFGDNLYMRNGKLELTGPLTEDADIHVDLENGTGVLTRGYNAQNGTEVPEAYFTFAVGYDSRFTSDGEVELISGWNSLKKTIESAPSGSVIVLDKDYAAADSDDRIKIENKNITIDLNSYTLNRRRRSLVNDGHVLEVFGGATLTIKDSSEDQTGTITGAWSHEGGIFVNGGATLNLQGGTITGNRADTNGGGIYADGTVNMTGGRIEGNQTDGSGGGICMTGSGTLNLEGGTITGNEAGDRGGGVMIDGGTTVTVKGSPVVSGNRGMRAGADIYLPSGKMLTVTDAFGEGARLGVATQGHKGRITSGYSGFNGDADPAQYFVSTESYGVYLENGEVVLDTPKTYGETEYTDPFIPRNDQIADTDGLSSVNWMSGISGDRYLHEINIPGSHDSGMNRVHGAEEGAWQLISRAITPPLGGLNDWTSVVAELALGRAASMAKTQKLFIDEQLEAGARQLDIRLSCRYKDYKWYVAGYRWEDDGRNLWLCHGKVELGGTYLAENHTGDYLSFNEVLGWIKEFLEEHPTETILLDLRPETTDKSNYRTIFERTRTILEASALQINPSTGEPFLYKEPESDDFFAPYTHMPKLADCRGKIVLMPEKDDYVKEVGGFRLGSLNTEYVDEMDYQNTASQMAEQAHTVYSSVNGDGHVTLPTEAEADFDRLWYWELNCTGEHSGIMNYVNGDTPHQNADYVNPHVIGTGKTFDPEKAGQYIGWVRMDSFEAYYAEQIWITNFFDGLEYRTVTVKSGLDDPNYPDQTYQLLKGTKIDIPGNIYKKLGEGFYFDCWKAEDGTLYYPGDSFKVDEDVTFTAQWLEEGQVPVRAIWKDGGDADGLRPESVTLDVTTGAGTTTATLTEDQGWRTILSLTGEITDIVPDWDLAGGQYTYTCALEEGSGYALTFTHTPKAEINVSGTIRWMGDSEAEGKRPASVTIQLWENDQAEPIDSMTVNADENGAWAFDLGEFPQYENGEEIEYRITETMGEESAKLYLVSIEGFNVTNTYNPIPEKTAVALGVVEWDDGDDEKGLRPGKVDVTLLADGVEAGQTEASLKEELGTWAWGFSDIPLNNAQGEPIQYTISPAEVDGYTMTWEKIDYEQADGQAEEDLQGIYLFRITYTLVVPEEEKTPAAVEEAPLAKNPVYKGEPQALVEKGSASGGTLLYALGESADEAPDASAFREELPEATDAGTYYVWYYVKGDAFHTDTEEPACVTAPIRKAAQSIDAAGTVTGEVGESGKAIAASVTGVNGATEGVGTLSYEVTDGQGVVEVDGATGELTFIAPGNATVTVTAAGTGNYEQATREVTVVVAAPEKEKADPPDAPEAEATGPSSAAVADADGALEYAIVPKGSPAPGAGSEEWRSPDGDGAVEWDGLDPKAEYDVYARVRETAEKAASDPSEPAHVKTPGLAPEATAPQAGEGLSYTGEPQALVSAGEATGGTIEYALGADGGEPPADGWGASVPTATDAGDYRVWWRVVGDETHEDLGPAPIDVAIAKASQSIDAAGTVTGEVGEAGKAIAASVTGVNGATEGVGALSYEVTDGQDIVDVDGATGELTLIAPGTATIKVKAAETSNYEQATREVTVEVSAPEKEKADPPDAPEAEATGPNSAAVADADGALEYAIVPKGSPAPGADSEEWRSPDGDGAVEWDDLDPKAEYDVYARVRETAEKAASDPSEPAHVTTPGLAPEATAPTAIESLSYTGEPQALVSAGEATGGTVEYALGADGGEPPADGWGASVPTATDAGDYRVWWRVVGDKTHEDLGPAPIGVTVAKAAQSIDAAGTVTGEVGESGKAIAATVTGVNGATEGVGALSYEVTSGQGVAEVDAATGELTLIAPGTATVTVTAAGTGNYDEAETLVTVTVTASGEQDVSYFNTSGDGTVWTKGSGKTADFTFERSVDEPTTFGHFTGITVDGNTVDASNYTAESGSVIVSLKPEYLETLSVGEHVLTANFDDADGASADFTVVEAASPDKPDESTDDGETANKDESGADAVPKTGDENNPLLLMLLIGLSAALALFAKRRRNE